MKKLALALMAASAMVFGFGMVVSAQSYTQGTSISPNPVEPGRPFAVTYDNCQAGESITFVVSGATPASITNTCSSIGTVALSLLGQVGLGNAVGSFTAAPSAPGTYPGTATPNGQSPVRTFNLVIQAPAPTVPPSVASTIPATVPVGGLPTTGSGGVGTTTAIAIGLLVVGLGLFVVAQVRRRQTLTA